MDDSNNYLGDNTVMKIFEDWERLRRRHFLQVWSMLYAVHSQEGEDRNWAWRDMNKEIQAIVREWELNGFIRP